MRARSIIAITAIALVVVLVGLVVTAYALGRKADGTIPKGVAVAGIDVGGLTADQARARLEERYLARLRAPVTVVGGGRTFTLTARESHVAADLTAMVDAALDVGRKQGFIARAWRQATGGYVDRDIAPQVTFSRAAALRLVDRVRKALEVPAQDASVSFSLGGATITPGRQGTQVLASELHAAVDAAVADPGADRTIEVKTHKVDPKVTSQDLDAKYSTLLVVDREHFRLRLYKHLRLAKSYKVAIGAVGRETPAGLYHIQNKAVNPAWTEPYSDWVPKADQGRVVPGGSPENPLKARWLGIFDGAGIHGIDPSEYGTIGHAASHGCVRMRIPDVISLYAQVPVGAPIYIA
ncbi:MAG TPA: L,D-transpeptidase/peptidoglycan binding protein [Solirubrobacteraceae bacterium]|jgi:lipoprotein-anchoring transpeptidase ErfK/SrfK|nr:L,D-transpeptidase/peptidoglycan binding protein [Solirubrobacteraceae bacterium]